MAGPPAPHPLPPAWDAWLTTSLYSLTTSDRLRVLRAVTPTANAVQVLVPPPTLAAWAASYDGGDGVAGGTRGGGDDVPPAAGGASPPPVPVTLFSTNDYLGLSTHPRVRAAAAAAAAAVGCGPRSSGLVGGGYTAAHAQLEGELATLKEAEDCLLFSTGYAANTAVLGAFASSPDVAIFSDALNHASIVDGARLASRGGGASLTVYPHGDVAALDAALAARPSTARRAVVVTDSLFSMDGDFADMAALAALKRKHGFLLIIDEAHATLACGPRGGGAADAAGVSHAVDVHVGTLSKAFGAHGGFAALSRDGKRFLVNAGRPYGFSTAPPAPCVAAASAALAVSRAEPWRRATLASHAARVAAAVGAPPPPPGAGATAVSPIIPVVLGPEAAALAASARLLRRGLHVPAIRPPTVPPGTSRLRVSVSSAHGERDMDALLRGLAEGGVASAAGAGDARL